LHHGDITTVFQYTDHFIVAWVSVPSHPPLFSRFDNEKTHFFVENGQGLQIAFLSLLLHNVTSKARCSAVNCG
jgi:hypothetical protein